MHMLPAFILLQYDFKCITGWAGDPSRLLEFGNEIYSRKNYKFLCLGTYPTTYLLGYLVKNKPVDVLNIILLESSFINYTHISDI